MAQGRDNSGKNRTHSNIDNSTCAIVRSAVNIRDSCQCSLLYSTSGACVQVRPSGANLPTAARRAPSREAADGYTCTQSPGRQSDMETCQSKTAEFCHRDRPQRHLREHVQTWTLMEGATLATSSKRRKPERLELHSHAQIQTRKRVSGRSLV